MFFREQGSRNYVHVYCQANSYANDLSRTPPLNILIDLLKLINILDNKNNSALTKYDDSDYIYLAKRGSKWITVPTENEQLRYRAILQKLLAGFRAQRESLLCKQTFARFSILFR